MSKFNSAAGAIAGATSPVTGTVRAVTAEGGQGVVRDAKSELFLLAVANMVGEDTFYEAADQRDLRFRGLVRSLALEDFDWLGRMARWLRKDANMRSAPVVAAAEAVHARLQAGLVGGNRQLIDTVCLRADEPGELLAYWIARYGRAVPKPVKRGLADAVARLYTERSLLKYDSSAAAFRFGDVIDLVHPVPDPAKPWQGALFEYALDRRHNREKEIPDALGMLRARAQLTALPVDERRSVLAADGGAERLARAGMTWEALAGWLQGPLDAAAWSAVTPSMGYMALIRNLRNFDQAGVGDDAAAGVAAKLADPAEVAASRQLPMRFLSAYRAAPSLRWSWPLEQALGHSLANIPRLAGRTLVLVDTSGSMNAGFSRDGTLMRWDAAALFGIALAARCEHADVVAFSNKAKAFPPVAGESVLAALGRFRDRGYFMGSGTATALALKDSYAGHDRVVVLTDEQAAYNPELVTDAIPQQAPMYTWNLAGYRIGHAPSGSANRHTFGGLTDRGFEMIPLLERARSQSWPF
ncbi:MAG TPA: TROVE domain-containing protein [Actinocrinis sp.]